MNALRLIKRLWQTLPLSDHARWKVTSLLLEPILPLIKGSVVYHAYMGEKEWQKKCIQPFCGDPLPALPHQDKADIYFWGVIDWRFRFQRPQHLALGLAERGHRVFYISTSFVNTQRAGFELEQLDETGRLYNIRFHLKRRPRIYAAPPGDRDLRCLRTSVAALLEWTVSRRCLAVVQHPYWYEVARTLPASSLIYDCLDHHEGFGNTGEGIAQLERVLLRGADAVVVTSQGLCDFARAYNADVTLVRNAAEYDFFAAKPDAVFQDGQGRKVIGYYGAIAEWLDVELLIEVARSFSDCLLILVGADEVGARQRLAGQPNVLFIGEVKYAELPFYLHGMDVCLLPFRVTPLTLVTNPVKVYEYLSAGKPVVSVALPELCQFGGLVATASTHEEFVRQIEEALSNVDAGLQLQRKNFASMNTWRHRVDEFDALLDRVTEEICT